MRLKTKHKKIVFMTITDLLEKCDNKRKEYEKCNFTIEEYGVIESIEFYRVFYKGYGTDFVGTKKVCEEQIKREINRHENRKWINF